MLKKIISNTLAQLVAKFIGAGLTLVTTIVIIRLSGTEVFGDLTKSLVLIAVGFTAIDFGLNAFVVRSLGRSQNPRQTMAELLSARLLLSLVVVLVLNVLVLLLPGGYTPQIKSVFWLGSLAIIFQGLYTSMNAWFQYQENYWSSSWATIGGSLIAFTLTYYYALTSPSLTHFLAASTLGYGAMALLALYFGKGVFSLTLSLPRLTHLFKSSLLLGGILLASVAASKLDTIILGVFRSSGEVGEYGFAYRIFDVILVLPVFIMNAIYPRLIKENKEKAARLIRGSLVVLGILGCVAALVVWFAAPAILYIRPNLFLSVSTLRFLILSLPLFFLTAPLMWQQISLHREKNVLKIYLAAALLNGLLNLWLVPGYGAPAAALITGATELFILLSLVYSSLHETPTKL